MNKVLSSSKYNTLVYLGSRFHAEFWIICLIVSLGLFQSISLGFYQFRLVDAVLILSAFYAIPMFVKRRVNRKIRWLLSIYIIVTFLRIFFEYDPSAGIQSLKTLFGMSAAYLAPFIYFVVRESRVSRRILIRLLALGCGIALLSQLGLLTMGESSVGGIVNLGKILHIPSLKLGTSILGYQERTITVWRALSVGLTFALLLSNTKPWIKVVGVGMFFLQFAGGSGTRSTFIFIFLVPVILFWWRGSHRISKRFKRILQYGIIALIFVSVYLWSPFGGEYAKSSESPDTKTHYERVTEVLVALPGGGPVPTSTSFLNARLYVWDQYWRTILSNPKILLFGTGLANVDAWKWIGANKGLAHNMFLDAWGVTGLVNLLFIIIFLIFIFSDLKNLLSLPLVDTISQILVFSYATAVLYFLQYLMVQAVVLDRSYMIVFYLTAGILKPLANLLKVGLQLRNGNVQHI